MRIEYSKRFIKDLKNSSQIIKNNFKDRLNIFVVNRYHPILNNHSLSGRLKNCRSINVSGDWRAIFKEIKEEDVCYFVAIGSHSKLYY
jgi:addiction module RelE/StbE family toxin